ncbi:DNA-directed RNA polymerase subunit delta [Sporosarcina sp. G11-34]|uniref:DNA-directed RNA polymerase subunit delta n=1 Tax=Sporosarcina sp. G11-34 TaxID=2849605 RepID=UPI0022A9D015|nr:DNA-directed RNA polymerase subunit delta [Sporosarcina sp. G11-34]
MNIREMTKEQLAEESMIDIAYAVLTERGRGEHLTLRQLMDEVRKLNGVTVKAMAENMQQFYTDMNIDGRFLSIDDIRWGLREWYPVDTLEEETAPVVKVRKKRKKKKDVEDDEFDDIDDEDDEDDEEEEEIVEGFDEIDIEEDDEEDDDDEEEIVEIEVDLLDPDDELEVIPDDVDLEDDEDEEEEEEEE